MIPLSIGFEFQEGEVNPDELHLPEPFCKGFPILFFKSSNLKMKKNHFQVIKNSLNLDLKMSFIQFQVKGIAYVYRKRKRAQHPQGISK